MQLQPSTDLFIKVSNVQGSEQYYIPQKDNSFINILGSEIDFKSSVQNVILALTNIDDDHITKFDLPNMLTLIIAIRKHFPHFAVDSKIVHCINRYIDDLFNQSIWLRLSNSVDCSFDKMNRRKFPYFNCVDEDWKSINTRAVQAENPYPAEMGGQAVTSTKAERREGWKAIEEKAINLLHNLEKNASEDKLVEGPLLCQQDGCIQPASGLKDLDVQKTNAYNNLFNSGNRDFMITPIVPMDIKDKVHAAVTYRPKKDATAERNAESVDSNYMAFDLLEPQFYPDLDEYKMFMGLLCNSGLTNLAIKLLYILPLTYECCHIIKTEWYWKVWNELIYDEQLKNYVIYYSMYILKHEEVKSYSSVPLNARFTFDIHEARLIDENIPRIGIDKHPLIHLMEPLGYKSSYMLFFLEGKRHINTLDEFKHRLSIATDGLLDGIDLSQFKACLSGSILVPCIATNPLEERFKHIKGRNQISFVINDLFDSILDGSYNTNNRNDEAFAQYLECYYPSNKSIPDVDLSKYMEPIQSIEQYEAQKFEDLNSTNRDYPNEIDHAVAYNVLSDLDISIHTDTFEEFKVNVYGLFEVLRKRAEEIAASKLSAECKYDGRSVNECKYDGRIYIRRIRRVNNFKYSIYGPGINRPIDLFWITKSPDTFVEQFHLGVVRSHWNGHMVRIMQSALAALLTGINHDYRWMSSNKAPAIPVLKYVQRGYTTPLNRFERPILIEYMTAKAEWTNSFKSQAAGAEQIYNPVTASHIFFMVDHTKSGIRYGLKPLDVDLSSINKINNERIKWNPIICSTHGIPLEYYNSSRNSISVPTLDIIDKYIARNKTL